MNESYAEAGVKRKENFKTYSIRVLLIFIVAVLFFFSLSNTILLFLSAILIVVIMYVFQSLKVEYEYVFCDGQLDFDKIML